MEEEIGVEDLDTKIINNFEGRIVRKDLTKKIKEGANVPVYVLEYLLGKYCATTEPVLIDQGVENVKNILAENYVRPDEAQKILQKVSVLQKASQKIIQLKRLRDTPQLDFSEL